MFKKILTAKHIALVIAGGALGTALDQRRSPRIVDRPVPVMIDSNGIIHSGSDARARAMAGDTAPDPQSPGYWDKVGILHRTAIRHVSVRQTIAQYYGHAGKPVGAASMYKDYIDRVTGKKQFVPFNNPIKALSPDDK